MKKTGNEYANHEVNRRTIAHQAWQKNELANIRRTGRYINEPEAVEASDEELGFAPVLDQDFDLYGIDDIIREAKKYYV